MYLSLLVPVDPSSTSKLDHAAAAATAAAYIKPMYPNQKPGHNLLAQQYQYGGQPPPEPFDMAHASTTHPGAQGLQPQHQPPQGPNPTQPQQMQAQVQNQQFTSTSMRGSAAGNGPSHSLPGSAMSLTLHTVHGTQGYQNMAPPMQGPNLLLLHSLHNLPNGQPQSMPAIQSMQKVQNIQQPQTMQTHQLMQNYGLMQSMVMSNQMSHPELRQTHLEPLLRGASLAQGHMAAKFSDADVELLRQLFVAGERHKWKQITKEINHRSSIRRGEESSGLSDDLGTLAPKNVSPTYVVKQYQNFLGLPKNLVYFGVLGLLLPYVVAQRGWDDVEDTESFSTPE